MQAIMQVDPLGGRQVIPGGWIALSRFRPGRRSGAVLLQCRGCGVGWGGAVSAAGTLACWP